MTGPTPDTDAGRAAQRRRNMWIGLLLGIFAGFVFLVTLVQLKASILERPL
jgi:hypothetical protein